MNDKFINIYSIFEQHLYSFYRTTYENVDSGTITMDYDKRNPFGDETYGLKIKIKSHNRYEHGSSQTFLTVRDNKINLFNRKYDNSNTNLIIIANVEKQTVSFSFENGRNGNWITINLKAVRHILNGIFNALNNGGFKISYRDVIRFVRNLFGINDEQKWLTKLPPIYFENCYWPFSINTIRKYNSFSKLLKGEYGHIKTSKFFDVHNPTHNLLILETANLFDNPNKFCTVISENDNKIISKIKQGNVKDPIKPYTLMRDMIYNYYHCKLEIYRLDDQKRYEHFLKDLIGLAFQLYYDFDYKYHFKAAIKSGRRLKEEHDELSYKIIEKKHENYPDQNLIINPVFYNLLPNKFELITTRKRLLIEADIQRNCVGGHEDKINSGSCAIYSIVYEDKRYTVEIKRNLKGTTEDNKNVKLLSSFSKTDDNVYEINELWLGQCYGIGNNEPPHKLVKEIKRYLQKPKKGRCLKEKFKKEENAKGNKATKTPRPD